MTVTPQVEAPAGSTPLGIPDKKASKARATARAAAPAAPDVYTRLGSVLPLACRAETARPLELQGLRLDLVCSREESRYAINAVLLSPDGYARATDGRCAARVRIPGLEGAITRPVYVSRETWQKLTRSKHPIAIDDLACYVLAPGGVEGYSHAPIDARFPDLDALVKGAIEDEPAYRVTINTVLLRALAQSVGVDCVTLDLRPDVPIVVGATLVNDDHKTAPKAVLPGGDVAMLLMPINAS